MSLSTLLLVIGSLALLTTLIIAFVLKKSKNTLMTFLQSFCGLLFMFSGWVKAIDPLGTAYKMEQYFAAFEVTFQGTWFKFLAPIFPALSEMSIGFSVFMIVFEIILGLMLLIGMWPKISAWAFFLLVAFFTVLTGFTYMTGYVPSGANFFEFSKWVPYKASNMQVTDCGCFGDFIKLEPKISFFKDIALLFPAVYFIMKWEDMYQLFSGGIRAGITGLSTLGVILYCFSNFAWDLPHTDFRPFKNGADIRGQKQVEMAAASDVQIIGWQMENTNTGEVVDVPNPKYSEVVKSYPKDQGWKVKDQLKSVPKMKMSKVSEFDFENADGAFMAEEFLEYPGYTISFISHKVKIKDFDKKQKTVSDTIYTKEYSEDLKDTITVKDVVNTKEEYVDYHWEEGLRNRYLEKVKPLSDAALDAGVKTVGIIGGLSSDQLDDFKNELGLKYEIYHADDILLKTIVRSNPGLVLWKDGTIVQKWHYNKMPTFEELQEEYLK